MKSSVTFAIAIAVAIGIIIPTKASRQSQVIAGDPHAVTQLWAMRHADQRAWHGGYYYLPYGHPTALVVPPTAHMRQTYSWGVSQNLMYPLTHQFGRSATSPGALPPGTFQAAPHWPSHTDQFGIYYVRGPW